MKREWKTFEVDPSLSDSIKQVCHTSHVEVALQILRDGHVKAFPSYEYPALGRKKIRIAWTSANHWHKGSRYGSVEFHFPIDRLLKGRKIYWVGVNTDDTLPRCQFLLTENNYDKLFQRYNPRKNRGPWRIDGDEHYFNRGIVIELMHDHDLSLKLADEIKFSNHNERQCSRHAIATDCPEVNYFGDVACQHWLRHVGGSGLNLSKRSHLWPYKEGHRFALRHGIERLLHAPFQNIKYTDVPTVKQFPAAALARSALHSAAAGNSKGAKHIAGLFSSEEQLAEAFSEVLCESLGLAARDYMKERMQSD